MPTLSNEFFSVVDQCIQKSILDSSWTLLSATPVSEIEQRGILSYMVRINDTIGDIHFYYTLADYQGKESHEAWQLFRREFRSDFGLMKIVEDKPALFTFISDTTGWGVNTVEDRFGSKKKSITLSAFWNESEYCFDFDKYHLAATGKPPTCELKVRIIGETDPTLFTTTNYSSATAAGAVYSTILSERSALNMRWMRNYAIECRNTRLFDNIPETFPDQTRKIVIRSSRTLSASLIDILKSEALKSGLSFGELVKTNRLLTPYVDFINKIFTEKFESDRGLFSWGVIESLTKKYLQQHTKEWQLKLFSHILNLQGNHADIRLEGACYSYQILALSYVIALVCLSIEDDIQTQSIRQQLMDFMDPKRFQEELLSIFIHLEISAIARRILDTSTLQNEILKQINACPEHSFAAYAKACTELPKNLHDALEHLVDHLYAVYQEDRSLCILAGYGQEVNRTDASDITLGSHAIFVVLDAENKNIMIFNTGGGHSFYHDTFATENGARRGLYPYLLKINEEQEEATVKAYITRALLSAHLPRVVKQDSSTVNLALPLLYNDAGNTASDSTKATLLAGLSKRPKKYLEQNFKYPVAEQLVGNCTYASVEHYLLVALPGHCAQYRTLLNCMSTVMARWQTIAITPEQKQEYMPKQFKM